jgi:hypothetical protein
MWLGKRGRGKEEREGEKGLMGMGEVRGEGNWIVRIWSSLIGGWVEEWEYEAMIGEGGGRERRKYAVEKAWVLVGTARATM